MSSLQPLSPASLDRVVKKCLAKDPDARWQSAHDLHDELAWIAADTTSHAAVAAAASRPWRERAGWIAAVAVAVVSCGALGSRFGMARHARASDAQEMRLQIVTPPGASLVGFAISPDRRALVYQATTDGRSPALDSFARLGYGAGRWTGTEGA